MPKPTTRTNKRPSGANQTIVVHTPGWLGGRARIDGTRLSVWGLVASRDNGFSDDQLLTMYQQGYSWLTQTHLDAAWAYAKAHRAEIDRDTRENTEGAQ